MKTLIFLLMTLLLTITAFAQPRLRQTNKPQFINGCFYLQINQVTHDAYIDFDNKQFVLNRAGDYKEDDYLFIEGVITTRELHSNNPIIRIKKIELCTCCNLGYRGDVNKSGNIDIADLVAIISWIEHGMYEPECSEYLDMNGDDIINSDDFIYLTNYMFEEGPFPIDCE